MKSINQKITVEKNGRVRVQTVQFKKSRTDQSMAAACDINNIMAKYKNDPSLWQLHTFKKGAYADFSNITDYQGMLDTVKYAQEAFNLLPANIKARFRNDPGDLLRFIQDDANYEEAQKLGLIPTKPKTETTETETTPKTTPKKTVTKSASPSSAPNHED